jgi:hypothetical protein
MTRRLILAFLSVIFVYGLSIGFALQPTLAGPKLAQAAKCDFDYSACFDACRKSLATINASLWAPCGQQCNMELEELRKKGQCK